MTRGALVFLAVVLTGGVAGAHEVRPGYLELREVEADVFDVLWKVPAKGGRRLSLQVQLPKTCAVVVPKATYSLGAAFADRWRVRCPSGLGGGRITIDGLAVTKTDVLVRIAWRDGRTHSARLSPAAPSFEVARAPVWTQTAWTYLVLGVEHILLGPDHLLFVLALLLIVQGAKPLLFTITSFTVAHSITLALATLGWVTLPGAPVEALIALSIVFVARELLTLQAGGTTVTLRKPWLVAFAFGLLHGLGFAGALSEVGLPQTAVPLALASFNIGVELGQVAFVAVVLALQAGARRLFGTPTWVAPALAYAIGTTAAFWFLSRLGPLVGR